MIVGAGNRTSLDRPRTGAAGWTTAGWITAGRITAGRTTAGSRPDGTASSRCGSCGIQAMTSMEHAHRGQSVPLDPPSSPPYPGLEDGEPRSVTDPSPPEPTGRWASNPHVLRLKLPFVYHLHALYYPTGKILPKKFFFPHARQPQPSEHTTLTPRCPTSLHLLESTHSTPSSPPASPFWTGRWGRWCMP